MAAGTVGGEKEPVAVGRYRGLRLPGAVAIDSVAQTCLMPAMVVVRPTGAVDVAVGIASLLCDAREEKLPSVGGGADGTFWSPQVEGCREFMAAVEG